MFYSIPYSLSSKDDVLEFDTKISEDDMGGSSNSAGEFDLGTAVELLGLDDEDAKTQASRLQGAYMSFLLLRHLRLRDLQRSVRNVLFVRLFVDRKKRLGKVHGCSRHGREYILHSSPEKKKNEEVETRHCQKICP